MDLEKLTHVLTEHGVHDIKESALEVLSALVEEPWGATTDIAACAQMEASPVHRLLRELEKRRLVASTRVTDGSGREDGRTTVKVRATRERVPRWYLDGEWPERLESSWHSRPGLGCLLERQPVVDQVYPAAAEIARILGRIQRVKWFRRWPWDAVAEYTDGWVMFLWSGYPRKGGSPCQEVERMGSHGHPGTADVRA